MNISQATDLSPIYHYFVCSEDKLVHTTSGRWLLATRTRTDTVTHVRRRHTACIQHRLHMVTSPPLFRQLGHEGVNDVDPGSSKQAGRQ